MKGENFLYHATHFHLLPLTMQPLPLFQDGQKLTLIDQTGRVQRAWQESTPRLLIFDNCEEEGLLEKWMPVTGGCRVLVTSRRTEWMPAFITKTILLNTLPRTNSIAILQKTTERLTNEQADAIAAEVGDLPLALYLAGGFLRQYQMVNVADYCRQLRQKSILQHPSLQGRGLTFSPTGHDLHISRTLALSLEYLDPHNEIDQTAKKILRRAAYFAPAEPIPTKLLGQTVFQDHDDIMTILLIEDGFTRLRQIGVLLREKENTVILHPLLAEFTINFLVDGSQTQQDVETTIIQQLTDHFESNKITQTLPFPSVHLQFMAISAKSRQDANSGKLLMFLGAHLRNLDEYERADHYLQHAITTQQQVLGDNHPDHADSLTKLGISYYRQGKVKLAKTALEQSLTIRKNVFGWHHSETAKSLTHLGLVITRLRDYETASHYLEQALTIQEKVLPRLHLDTALTFNGLSTVNRALKKNELAQQYGEKALSIRKQVLGNKPHLDIAQSYNSLGILYINMKEREKAIHALLASLKICEKLLGEKHYQIAVVCQNLGTVYRGIGQYNESISCLERALVIREMLFGKEQAVTMLTMKEMGLVYWDMGKKEKARELLTRVLPILEKNYPPDHSILIDIQSKLSWKS